MKTITQKLTICIVMILGFVLYGQAQCPIGDVAFSTQAQVDAFAIDYPNCTEIQGNLTLSSSNITNLDGLSALTSIGGEFYISNTALTNLDGLSALTNIEIFVIYGNNALTNLDGLSALTAIGGHFTIQDNSQLTNLDGLSALTSIGGFFSIRNTSQLTNLDGLSALTSIGGSFTIQDNSQLTNLDGLSALTGIGGQVSIQNNSQLTNLDGLSALTNIGGQFAIRNNSQLTNLDGLSALTSIGGDLFIEQNTALTDISGLENITGITGLYIYGNLVLSVCHIASVCAFLGEGTGGRYIAYNATGCESESAITTACPASVCPTGNITLTTQADVDAFAINYPNCTEIQGNLVISGSTITNLNGLSALTSIGGYLEIKDNNALTDISVLENITGITELYIVYNPVLSVCHITSVCAFLEGTGNRMILGNGAGCESPIAVTTACTTLPAVCPTGDVTLTTQAEVDAFAIDYPNCTELPGNLFISGSITNLNGLSTLTTVGGNLRIEYATLTNLDGLSALTSIGGYLYIVSNSTLTNLDGLSALTSVGGYLRISFNPTLTNLGGLSALTSMGGYLYIHYNSQLTNLEGLSALTNVGGSLTVESNHALTNLNGLSPLTSVGGSLIIENNSILTNVDGLNALTSVGGGFAIYENHALTNLNGLTALTSIGEYLAIEGNNALTDISGLENITGITELYIQNNPVLSVCHIASVCAFLEGTGNRTIRGNATGCESESAVITACSSVGIESLEATNWSTEFIEVYPNPNNGVFTVSTNQLQENTSLEIYSQDGRLIYSTVYSGTETTIDLQNESRGVYILKVNNTNYFRVIKN